MENKISCPRCSGPPKVVYNGDQVFTTYICYESCGFSFWTLQKCPRCHQRNSTVLTHKPILGHKLTCTPCQSQLYHFRCPQCEVFFFRQNYSMGSTLTCLNDQCGHQFKNISCPCGNEIKLSKEQLVYQGTTIINCKCCTKTIVFTVCPFCNSPQYHIDPLTIGDRIRCSSCKEWRKYVPCPSCGRSLAGTDFGFYQPVSCAHCQIHFQYSKCPYNCPQVSYNILTQKPKPQRKCYNCNQHYSVMNCRKCKQPLYYQNIKPSTQAVIDNCPACKHKIQYYYCPCGNFNYNAEKCQNQYCNAKPGSVTDNIALREKEKAKKEKKEDQGDSGEDKQCKLCFNGDSNTINEACGHVSMCETCLGQFLKGKMQDAKACPICRTIGRYYKYKKPIFS